MHADEPLSSAASPPSSSSPQGAADSASSRPSRVRAGLRCPLWLVTAGAGIVAGLAAGFAGEITGEAIPISVVFPPGYENMGGYQKDAVRAMAVGKAEKILEQKKAAAAYGLLGALLGISMGLTGGWFLGSLRLGFASAVMGLIVGAAVGAGISFAAVPLFFRYQDPESSGLLLLFMTHATIFVGIGAAAGLALGNSLGDRQALGRAVIGGSLGALIGTFLIEAFISLAYPLMRTYQPVPSERLPRLMAHLCVAICTALVAGLVVGTPIRKQPTSRVE
jgi:hypothetical protein